MGKGVHGNRQLKRLGRVCRGRPLRETHLPFYNTNGFEMENGGREIHGVSLKRWMFSFEAEKKTDFCVPSMCQEVGWVQGEIER